MTEETATYDAEKMQLLYSLKAHWIEKTRSGIVDEGKIVEAVNALYKNANMPEPQVHICASPKALRDKLSFAKEEKIKRSERRNDKMVSEAAEQLEKNYLPLDIKIAKQTPSPWDIKREVLETELVAPVFQEVERYAERVKNTIKEEMPQNRESPDSMVLSFSHIARYDFLAKADILKANGMDEFRQLAESGVWEIIPFSKEVYVSVKPFKLLTEPEGQRRLHSEVEPAVQWSDGYAQCYVQGVYFERPLFEKLVQKKMTAREAVELKNVEQRTIAMRLIGYDKMVKELKGTVIDSKIVPNPKTGGDMEYQVIEVDLKDDRVPARFVKVVCHSTLKETLLRVDPRSEATRDCIGAISWTFNEETENYAPIIET